MSIFNTILQKLGIEKPATPAPTIAPAKSTATVAPAASVRPAVSPTFVPTTSAPAVTPVVARPVAVPVVDVVSKLEKLAGSNSGLDWKVSIVDLLKLLGIDSSYEARKNLATELGCPANLMNDSANMNIWLHKTVLQKVAENGGNIPDSLLH